EGPGRGLRRGALALPLDAPPDGGRALMAARLEEGAELWPGVALALGWARPDDAELRHLGAAPGALRAAAARAAGAGLRLRAAGRPVALLLDDAQWADEATLDALEYAAMAEARAPLFACALARPAFLDLRPAWGERAAAAVAVDVAPLDDEAAVTLCRRMLLPAEDVPKGAVDRLTARAQGVPLLLVELVR